MWVKILERTALGLIVIFLAGALWVLVSVIRLTTQPIYFQSTTMPLHGLTVEPAVLLYDSVTGQGDRIVTDPEIIAAAEQSFVFISRCKADQPAWDRAQGQTDVPIETPLFATYQSGVLMERYTCLRAVCGPDGRSGKSVEYDVSALIGHGAPIRRQTQTFTDYDAYLAAHSAISRNQNAWFDTLGAHIPDPRPAPYPKVQIDLPMVIWGGLLGSDVRNAELSAAVRGADLPGTVHEVSYIPAPDALILDTEGKPILHPKSDRVLRLIRYKPMIPRITLFVPEDLMPQLEQSLTKLEDLPISDVSLADALSTRLTEAGLAPDRPAQFDPSTAMTTSQITVLPPTVWTIVSIHRITE